MITPNKVIPVGESALGRTPVILEEGPGRHDLVSLWNKVGHRFESIDQFLLTIDVLYVLGKVELDLAKRELVCAQ